jgi:hypothetical protein
MEVVKSPTGVLHIIFNKEEQKMLCHAISGGSQAQIEFADDTIKDDPFKNFKGNTRQAIRDAIKSFRTKEFTLEDVIEIRKKYYVPSLKDSFFILADRGYMTIKRHSPTSNLYQFSEQLCRHFGN